MKQYSDESYNLRIELDTKHFELSPAEIEDIEGAIDPLREPVAKFPVSDLYLTIEHHPRSGSYRVKAALQLPGRGLATGGVHELVYPAVQQSINRLVHKLIAYEDRLDGAEEKSKHEKGTRHEVMASQDVDSEAIAAAVEAGDYAEFRTLMFAYEEALRDRVGRWIQRYPEIEARLMANSSIADIVEEVFLTAFEQFGERPEAVPVREWLEGLIDPSVKLLSTASDEELENLSFARTLVEEQQASGGAG